jgi:glucuronate isomerase
MTASAPTGLELVWPAEPRARALAVELYQTVAELPLISVHNGLPARYLAEDLPFTDPVSLLVSHDQGVQAMLRAHGIRAEFSPTDGWQTERASRQAFALLWRHMVEVHTRPWMQAEYADEVAPAAELPPFRAGQDADEVYDELAARLAEHPTYPRRVLAAAKLARLATSDDPADDLQAHRVLAEDPAWAGRVVPTFSPDRYLDPGPRGWRTDADLLAEVTGTDTETLDGFLAALRARRIFFLERGAVASEHHCSDVAVARLGRRDAAELYQLARSGELLPGEALALESHLLWETGRMSAEDGLAMAIFPPAGFRSRTAGPGQAPDDRGVADRVRPLLADFGSAARFSLRLFTIDSETYASEIVPLAARHPALTPVPPTRFADDPAGLRAVRVAAVEAVGATRSLGIVDDMSGPFALARRHRLGRRLDAGALAELVVAGRLSAEQAHADLADAVGQKRVQQS